MSVPGRQRPLGRPGRLALHSSTPFLLIEWNWKSCLHMSSFSNFLPRYDTERLSNAILRRRSIHVLSWYWFVFAYTGTSSFGMLWIPLTVNNLRSLVLRIVLDIRLRIFPHIISHHRTVSHYREINEGDNIRAVASTCVNFKRENRLWTVSH